MKCFSKNRETLEFFTTAANLAGFKTLSKAGVVNNFLLLLLPLCSASRIWIFKSARSNNINNVSLKQRKAKKVGIYLLKISLILPNLFYLTTLA